jgi:hypothetical protein
MSYCCEDESELILFRPASESQRKRVDSCVETLAAVGKRRLERIPHRCRR